MSDAFEYDLTKPLTWAECQAMDRGALAAGPVARYHDGSPVFVRYDDVAHMLNNPDAHLGYGSQQEQIGITQGLLHQVIAGSFIVADPPTHARLRSLVSRAFAVRPMERMRAVARKTAEQALDSIRSDGEFDAWEDVAGRVPLRVMCSLLGIPEAYAEELRAFLRAVGPAMLAPDCAPDVLERAERALERLYAYAEEVSQEKLANPEDDLISLLAIAERDGKLSRLELQSMITMLLFAGTDTTKSLIGMSLFTLARHPEQLAMLVADPELAEPAVEEVLRFSNPSPWVSRFALQRMERGGIVLEPGALFILSLATAGLDADHFADPWTFDIRRKDAQHLSFGRGRHFCLGAALARVEVQEVLRALALRGLRLEVIGEPRWIRAGAMVEPADSVRLRARR